MTNPIGDLVVKRRTSPLLRYSLAGVTAVAAVIGGIGLFEHGEAVAGFHAEKAARQEAQAKARISRLSEKVASLTGQLAVSKRSLETDTAAYGALSAALKQSDQDVMDLREKLGFYHAILGASNKAAGLTINQFHMVMGKSAWHYQLVLVQSFAFHQWVYAQVRFTVQGQEGGHSSDISYPSLVGAPLTMHFKYFDNARGRLVLPKGFVPHRIVVQVVADGHVTKRVYTWAVAS